MLALGEVWDFLWDHLAEFSFSGAVPAEVRNFGQGRTFA
jgi:hypothetical protein